EQERARRRTGPRPCGCRRAVTFARVKILAFCCALAAGLAVCAPGSAAARQMEDMKVVVVRTIDKLSARTHTFDIPVEKTVQFGTSLFIKVRACRKSSPLEQPESAA